MASKNSETHLIKKVYKTTAQSLKNNPALFLPFLIFAIFESLVLILIYLAPRMPFITIFGPPIRAFWGERFLHYPFNFLLLPKLASLSRMVLTVVLSSLLTGMAVAIIFDVYNKKQINLGKALQLALKKYMSLFIIIFIVTALFYFTVKIISRSLTYYFLIAGHSRLLFLKPQIWMGQILICINFMLVIFIQSVFIYVIPVLIIEKGKLIASIIKSLTLFRRLFIQTIILVGLPMLIYIPVIILESNTVFLINKLFPEFILWVLFLSIIISSLVIDTLVTVSVTVLYLMHKEKVNQLSK